MDGGGFGQSPGYSTVAELFASRPSATNIGQFISIDHFDNQFARSRSATMSPTVQSMVRPLAFTRKRSPGM